MRTGGQFGRVAVQVAGHLAVDGGRFGRRVGGDDAPLEHVQRHGAHGRQLALDAPQIAADGIGTSHAPSGLPSPLVTIRCSFVLLYRRGLSGLGFIDGVLRVGRVRLG